MQGNTERGTKNRVFSVFSGSNPWFLHLREAHRQTGIQKEVVERWILTKPDLALARGSSYSRFRHKFKRPCSTFEYFE